MALGQTASVVGVLTVLGLLLGLGGEAQSPVEALQRAGFVLAGALLQTGLAAAVHRSEPFAPQHAAVADVYRALAAYARDSSGDPAALKVTAALDAARPLVSPTPAPAAREMRDALRGLLDEADRIRLELVALAAVGEQSSGSEEESAVLLRLLREILAQAATSLEGIAPGLHRGRGPEGADAALEQFAEQLTIRTEAIVGRLPLDAQGRLLQVPDRVISLAGELRAVRQLAAVASGSPETSRLAELPSFVPRNRVLDAVRTLRSNATAGSAAGRHAIWLGLLLPATELLGRALPLAQGYWVPLTVLFVLRPDFTTTFTRGLSRVAGTGVGVVLASVLAAALPGQGAASIAVVVLSAWGTYAFFLANYALFSVFVTALVVFLLDVLQPQRVGATIVERGVDTLLGGAIALAAYLLWPTWERQRLPEGVAGALESAQAYARIVLGRYVDPRPDGEESVLDAGAAARAARSDAAASLEKAATEPTGGGLDLDTARGVLAGLDRVLPALDVLAAHVGGREQQPLPQLRGFAADVDAALGILAAAARSTRPPRRLPRLRRRLEALVRSGATGSTTASDVAQDLAVVFAQADVLVDAIETISHVLRSEPPARRTIASGAGRPAPAGSASQ
ncbi:MAG: FUSC family protein [Actinomycetota bacterium]|nr:FUSC family protein [Actinomycetota bacterium]